MEKKRGFLKRRHIAAAGAILLAAALCFSCVKVKRDQTDTWGLDENKKLIVYTSHKEEVYGPIIQEFEERTGIWVEVRAGGTTELLEAIRQEEGSSTCDVMFGGGVESYEAYKDCFWPYECGQKEALNLRYQSEDNLWTPFTELPIVFIYNNKLVEEDETPKGWEELLTDTWKGKIAFADPGKSGSSCTVLATMIQVLDMDEHAVLERFAKVLDGKIAEGSGAVVDEVSSGARLVGITLEETARKRIASGADIAVIYPEEGTSSVPDGCALVKDAPHEENAKKFIDFTVSRDVQRLAVERFMRRTIRTDISQEAEEDTMKIIEFDLEWAGRQREEILEVWDTLMKGYSHEKVD